MKNRKARKVGFDAEFIPVSTLDGRKRKEYLPPRKVLNCRLSIPPSVCSTPYAIENATKRTKEEVDIYRKVHRTYPELVDKGRFPLFLVHDMNNLEAVLGLDGNTQLGELRGICGTSPRAIVQDVRRVLKYIKKERPCVFKYPFITASPSFLYRYDERKEMENKLRMFLEGGKKLQLEIEKPVFKAIVKKVKEEIGKEKVYIRQGGEVNPFLGEYLKERGIEIATATYRNERMKKEIEEVRKAETKLNEMEEKYGKERKWDMSVLQQIGLGMERKMGVQEMVFGSTFPLGGHIHLELEGEVREMNTYLSALLSFSILPAIYSLSGTETILFRMRDGFGGFFDSRQKDWGMEWRGCPSFIASPTVMEGVLSIASLVRDALEDGGIRREKCEKILSQVRKWGETPNFSRGGSSIADLGKMVLAIEGIKKQKKEALRFLSALPNYGKYQKAIEKLYRISEEKPDLFKYLSIQKGWRI